MHGQVYPGAPWFNPNHVVSSLLFLPEGHGLACPKPERETSSSRQAPAAPHAKHTAAEMTSSRNDKRWLKSVTDPDLVSFFEDSQFDAGVYAKGFFEQREASHAAKRCATTKKSERAMRA